MKRILPLFIMLTFSIPVIAQTHVYKFNNNLNTSIGPALTEVLSSSCLPTPTFGSFATQTITTASGTCGTSSVFTFKEGGGLSYPNPIIGGTYTIHLFFKFNVLSNGYQRLIDFTDGALDDGIYTLNDNLSFFPTGLVGTPGIFQTSNYALLSIVRNGATNLINVYVNGAAFVTNFDDASGTYAGTIGTPIIFFRDDNQVICEDAPGAVKYISLQATTSTAAEIASLWTSICSVALPLKLTDFSGTLTPDNKVSLNWETASEEKVSHFQLQNSIDGIHYRDLVTLPAHNNFAGSKYNFTDNSLLPQLTYYRLTMVDQDGNATYSNVVKIKRSSDNQISIFPNPAKDMVTISGLKPNGTLQISGTDGKILLQQQVTAPSTTINISTLEKGIYILQYQVGGSREIQKIIKK